MAIVPYSDPLLHVWDDLEADVALEPGSIPKAVADRLANARRMLADHNMYKRCTHGQDCFVWTKKYAYAAPCDICGVVATPSGSQKPYLVNTHFGAKTKYKNEPIRHCCTVCFPEWVKSWGPGHKACSGEKCQVWYSMATQHNTHVRGVANTHTSASAPRPGASSTQSRPETPPPPPGPPPLNATTRQPPGPPPSNYAEPSLDTTVLPVMLLERVKAIEKELVELNEGHAVSLRLVKCVQAIEQQLAAVVAQNTILTNRLDMIDEHLQQLHVKNAGNGSDSPTEGREVTPTTSQEWEWQ